METNSTTAAPQVADGMTMYDHWQMSHIGTIADFYAFITTPSGDRSIYLSEISCNADITSRVLIQTYKR